MQIMVRGRHLGRVRFDSDNIITDFRAYPEGVTVRLDDKAHDEWWQEIDIPKEVLQKLLKEMEDESQQT